MVSNKITLYTLLAALGVLIILCAIPTPHQDAAIEDSAYIVGYLDGVHPGLKFATDANHKNVQEVQTWIFLHVTDESGTQYQYHIELGGIWSGEVPKDGTLVILKSSTGHVSELQIGELKENGHTYRYVAPGGNYYYLIVTNKSGEIVCGGDIELSTSKEEVIKDSICYQNNAEEIANKTMKLHVEQVYP